MKVRFSHRHLLNDLVAMLPQSQGRKAEYQIKTLLPERDCGPPQLQ